MKRTLLLSTAIYFATLGLSAQSFTVINKNGEKTGFNNVDVESIEFSTKTLDPAPVYTTIDFNSVLQSITPADGAVDLTLNPTGLGKIVIELNGRFMIDEKANHEIVLGNSESALFSRRPNAEGMYIYRDMLAGKTSFTYEFNLDGFTTPGYYYLYIPEGTYTDTNGNPLGATSRVYYIDAPAPVESYVATPTPGTIEQLDVVTLKYDNYPVISIGAGAKAYVRKAGSSNPEAILTPDVTEDGTITFTIQPAITTAGTYSISIPAGTFTLRTEEGAKSYLNKEINLVYELEGAAQLPPKVGDFYYSDGSWNSMLVDKGDVKPIGVVFYLGQAGEFGDSKDNYKTKAGEAMSDFHGYVVAFKDATIVNGEMTTVSWSPFNGNDPGAGCSSETTDFKGYTNTLAIKERADKDFNGLSADSSNFPAAYYATEYFENQVPAPAQSSGWFLPSAYQLKYIYDKVYFDPQNGDDNAICVEKSLKKLADIGGAEMYVRDSEYWTSTEQYDSNGKSYRAYYVCFDSSNFKPGFISELNKNWDLRVRSILAF